MKKLSMRQMLEAGAHFGHKTKFWNPKMEPYIYGERNGIHIINLESTINQLNEACDFIKDFASQSRTILFVGTKPSVKEEIKRAGSECGMPYVSNRWLGGTLTNNMTISKSIKKMEEIEESLKDENTIGLTKKEVLTLRRSFEKLEKGLGGIREMKKLPDALFIIDVNYEKNAVQEALVLGIPIVAVVDTNSSPDGIDYLIASNDDSRSTAKYITSTIIESFLEGKKTIPILEEIDDEFVEVDKEGNISPSKIKRKKKIVINKNTKVAKAEEPEEKDKKPKAEKPKAEKPKAEKPKAEEPKAEKPKAEEPKVEEPEEKDKKPKAEKPKAEKPKAEEPKAEEPKAEEPEEKAKKKLKKTSAKSKTD